MGKLQIWMKECWLSWLLPWRPRSILDMVCIQDMNSFRDVDYIQNEQELQDVCNYAKFVAFIQICSNFMRFTWTTPNSSLK